MEAKDYFDGQLGLDIWEKKYRYGNESFDEWVSRVSGGDDDVRKLILEKKFMFAGRILAGRGLKDRKMTYSNCYVLPRPEDNLESIYETAARLARTFSYGGGVGIDLSNLAPEGTPINNAAKYTSGAVSFADLYNKTTELIGQDGRRGALMLSISSDHFELEKFINAKTVDNVLQKANLSVRVSDKFMQSVESGDEYEQVFERHGKTFKQVIEPAKIFKQLVNANYNWSEPGLLFWDEISRWHAMSKYPNYEFAGVNPCGEKPLIAGGSCLLGSLNLSEFVTDGVFDFLEFENAIRIAVRALNAVLDEGINKHPLEIQRKAAHNWRQIGLGIMGYADMLIKMKTTYGSDDAISLTQLIASRMCDTAFNESAIQAGIHGPFPNYEEKYTLKSDFIQANLSNDTINLIKKYGLRNAEILSIAPTGTISTMLNISGGIEPIFALEYNRRTESLHGKDVSYVMRPAVVQEYVDKTGSTDYPDYYITSAEISPEDRVHTQATWQKYIDASISSTVNLPHDATEEDIYNIYIKAWSQYLKGITVHRTGNMREGVLTTDESKKEDEKLKRGEWARTSDDIIYHKRKIYTGCGKITLFIGYSPSNDRIEELYLKRSGKGGCERSLDALIIAMSGMLRLGGSLDNIEKAFYGIGPCSSFVRARSNGNKLSSGSNCAYAILNALKAFKKDNVLSDKINESGGMCPECKKELIFEGGCITCKNCGYSKCD